MNPRTDVIVHTIRALHAIGDYTPDGKHLALLLDTDNDDPIWLPVELIVDRVFSAANYDTNRKMIEASRTGYLVRVNYDYSHLTKEWWNHVYQISLAEIPRCFWPLFDDDTRKCHWCIVRTKRELDTALRWARAIPGWGAVVREKSRRPVPPLYVHPKRRRWDVSREIGGWPPGQTRKLREMLKTQEEK